MPTIHLKLLTKGSVRETQFIVSCSWSSVILIVGYSYPCRELFDDTIETALRRGNLIHHMVMASCIITKIHQLAEHYIRYRWFGGPSNQMCVLQIPCDLQITVLLTVQKIFLPNMNISALLLTVVPSSSEHLITVLYHCNLKSTLPLQCKRFNSKFYPTFIPRM